MEKRQDAQIYELVYKPVDYDIWDNQLYTPLQVGTNRTNHDIVPLKDNTGDNISSNNDFYSEATGTYWIWKNAPHTKYVGQCQYRRRLQFIEHENFDMIFSVNPIIANTPIQLGTTLKKHIEALHPAIDTMVLHEIITQKYPQYTYSYIQNFVNGRILFYSSAYVMRWNEFDEYCRFLFGVLKLYSDAFGFDDHTTLRRYVTQKVSSSQNRLEKTDIAYHSLIGGFLQERLFTIWLLSKYSVGQILKKNFTFFGGIRF